MKPGRGGERGSAAMRHKRLKEWRSGVIARRTALLL
jgi:hypothetical protein